MSASATQYLRHGLSVVAETWGREQRVEKSRLVQEFTLGNVSRLAAIQREERWSSDAFFIDVRSNMEVLSGGNKHKGSHVKEHGGIEDCGVVAAFRRRRAVVKRRRRVGGQRKWDPLTHPSLNLQKLKRAVSRKTNSIL